MMVAAAQPVARVAGLCHGSVAGFTGSSLSHVAPRVPPAAAEHTVTT
jgi:hypothetical protein